MKSPIKKKIMKRYNIDLNLNPYQIIDEGYYTEYIKNVDLDNVIDEFMKFDDIVESDDKEILLTSNDIHEILLTFKDKNNIWIRHSCFIKDYDAIDICYVLDEEKETCLMLRIFTNKNKLDILNARLVFSEFHFGECIRYICYTDFPLLYD